MGLDRDMQDVSERERWVPVPDQVDAIDVPLPDSAGRVFRAFEHGADIGRRDIVQGVNRVCLDGRNDARLRRISAPRL